MNVTAGLRGDQFHRNRRCPGSCRSHLRPRSAVALSGLVDRGGPWCHGLTMLRRRVVDLGDPAPAQACPRCGTSLDPIAKLDLRRVAFQWRCAPGREPRTYELRCPTCKRLLVVYETRDGRLAPVPDQESALRSVRDRARDEAVQELE